MDFTPEQLNIQSILSAKKHLMVPRFQREYCWDDHVTMEFFKDIVSRLDFSSEGTVPRKLPYFMGTLLFLGTMHGTDGGNQLEIVDGQQRMTTITILLSALAARMHDINPSMSAKVFEYVLDTDNDGDPFPVLTTKTSYPFFQNYVQAPVAKREALISNPESEEDEAIKKAYDNYSKIIYVFLTIFLYLLKCPQSLILSALRVFCFCGKPHISRLIFLYFLYQTWLKSW
ncbi:DUF262 domain-containing protein [Bifidobacterium adolescentis]|nr:DUF262 domain-containing protein [Bifidobacterium adolescentis]